MKKIAFILFLQCLLSTIFAQNNILKETHLYSIKGVDTLYLDRYYTQEIVLDTTPKPTIVFMFGGGFYKGARDNKVFIPFFEDFAQRGYQIFSIDYRLGLQKVDPRQVSSILQFATIFENTVNLAVEDLYDATTFIVNNREKWNINPEAIVTFGSSAGAISAIQAEYYRTKQHPLAKKLPSNFKYAGVMGMAGAIFGVDEKVELEKEMAPILLFHGTADVNVPYGMVRFFRNGFYGSEFIAKQSEKLNNSYYFCSFRYHDHYVCYSPLHENRDDIQYFLTHFVEKSKKMKISKKIEDAAKPKIKEQFGAIDYIRANFMYDDNNEQ